MTRPLDTPWATPTPCPFCPYRASTMRDEIRHMQDAHPEVIDKRLRDAGFVKINGEWIDAHPEVIDKRLRDAGFVKINGEWIDALADPND